MSRVGSFFQGMTQPRDQYSDSAEGSHWFIKNCPGNTLRTVVQILYTLQEEWMCREKGWNLKSSITNGPTAIIHKPPMSFQACPLPGPVLALEIQRETRLASCLAASLSTCKPGWSGQACQGNGLLTSGDDTADQKRCFCFLKNDFRLLNE